VLWIVDDICHDGGVYMFLSNAIVVSLRFSLLGYSVANVNRVVEDKLKSLTPPVLLPDGSEFVTWEQPLIFSKTYYVDGSHPEASDEGPGSKAMPFRTISKAAEILQPKERVLVAEGVYREWVRPKRGGTSPDNMISYQEEPGAKVVIKGSRLIKDGWEPLDKVAGLWKLFLDTDNFDSNYNPFTIPNITPEQFDDMSWAQPWRGKTPYTLPRGLVFQNGRRRQQVNTLNELKEEAGTYWVDTGGRVLYLHPFEGKSPTDAKIEITTQRCVFAPEEIGLGYIHVKGFTLEHAGNPFPFPQYGALSTTRGHRWIIEGNTIRQVNSVGIDIGSQHWKLPKPEIEPGWHIVRRNTITDCGVCGIQGLASRNNLIEDNLLLDNAFHQVERYYETAGIKTHHNVNTLIRRNRIFDTQNGCGIWMDFANVNSRCCQNIIIGVKTMFGGIFIEASLEPNMIDHNFIWDTQGAGIYEHDCRGQIICHNFIGRSTEAGLWLRGKITERQVHEQPIVSGNHVAINNILFENKELIRTGDKQKELSNNISEGFVAEFDRENMRLTWMFNGELPKCQRMESMTHDFFDKSYQGETITPGPFGYLPIRKYTGLKTQAEATVLVLL